MSSLADQLRNRHLGSEDAAPAPEVAPAPAPQAQLVLADLPQLGGSHGQARPSWLATRGPGAVPQAPSSARGAGGSAGSGGSSSVSGNGGSGSSGSGSGSGGSSGGGINASPNKASVLTVTLAIPDRKIFLDAVRAVTARFGVKIEMANSTSPNMATVLIKGPTAGVVQTARGALEARLLPHDTVELTVHSGGRSALIGARGANVRALQEKHNVQIDLAEHGGSGPWNLELTRVTVTGPEQGLAAVREFVAELTAKKFTSVRRLPRAAAQLLLLNAEFGDYIRPASNEIALQGPLDEVAARMAAVDGLVREIEQNYVRKPLRAELAAQCSAGLPAPFRRELYAATQSALLDDTAEVLGPAGSVDDAVARIEQFLQARTALRLDIAQAHGRDGAHARVLARYLAAKGELARIARENDGVFISEPEVDEAGGVVYTIVGEKAAASRVRSALKSAVIARPPSSLAVIRGMRHPLVRRRAEASLGALEGPVAALLGPSDELYLEYKEPEDDFAPSDEDIARYIEEARVQLQPLTHLAHSLVKRKMTLKEREAQYVLKPQGPEAAQLYAEVIGDVEEVDVELATGDAAEPVSSAGSATSTAAASAPSSAGSATAGAAGAGAASAASPSAGANSAHATTTANKGGASGDEKVAHLIVIGVKQRVNAAIEAIPKIIELSRQHLLRTSHIQDFDIDPQLVRNVIGKNGAQIQKLRDQYEAKIRIDEAGHVRVQGAESQVRECTQAIREMQRRLRDEVTEHLQIPVAFHAKLIGPKGRHVRRLSEKHSCLIKFPKSRATSVEAASAAADDDSPAPSVANGAESGSGDEDEESILIRGPSRGVAAVKREFMDLVKYERDQSHVETMTIPASVVSRVVGRGGVGINTIRQDSGANIDINTAQDDDVEVEVTVKGEQRAVKAAVAQLQKAVELALDHTEKTLEIPQRHHRFLTGPQNSKRRELVANAGGDAENANKVLSIPPAHSTRGPNTVRISGPSAVVSKIESSILQIVADQEHRSQVTGELKVPRNRLRRVVGVEGSKIREVEDKFSVLVGVPRGRGPEDELASISISGAQQDDVNKAIDYLRELALPEEHVAKIPQSVWAPKLRNQLTTKFAVTIIPVAGDANASLEPPAQPEGTDFVLLDAPKIDVRIASKTGKEGLEAGEYLKQYDAYDSIAYLWLPSKCIRAVVGPGGKTIKKIRADTGCIIEVPSFESNHPVSIAGPRAKVEEARAAILRAAEK